MLTIILRMETLSEVTGVWHTPQHLIVNTRMSHWLTTSSVPPIATSDYHASRAKFVERHLASLLKLCSLTIGHAREQAAPGICRPNSYTQGRFESRGDDTVLSRTAFHTSGLGRSDRRQRTCITARLPQSDTERIRRIWNFIGHGRRRDH